MSGDIGQDFSTQVSILREKKPINSLTVEISVSARNLKDVDFLSVSDPICLLFVKDGEEDWREFGRTEPILNNLNPDFIRKFNISYYFEERQYLRFEIYDVDEKDKSINHKKNAFLGEYSCTLGQVVSNLRIKAPLTNSKNKKKVKGEIIVAAERQAESKEEIHLEIHLEDVDLKKKFGKKYPYLRLSKENDEEGFTAVHRTETKKNDESPKWIFDLSTIALCNSEDERFLKFEVYEDRNGPDKLLGETSTKLGVLRSLPQPISLDLTDPRKKEKKQLDHLGVTSGKLKLVEVTFQQQHTFLDYIYGGIQIKVTIGIDFSAANGPVNCPTSLHHFAPGGPLNQYARAIQAVGDILEDYDSDKMFPAYAFGLRHPVTKEVDHLYPLNGKKKDSECNGVKDVLNNYYDCLKSCGLCGPSFFSPIISHVSKQAADAFKGSEYHILLILTDGRIDDMAETKKAIIQAANHPLSIIVIGIGPGDFSAMKKLDSDDKALTYRQEKWARDIVQFVPYSDFDNRSSGTENLNLQEYLSREVLQEIPEQIVSYMRAKKIEPSRSMRSSTLV